MSTDYDRINARLRDSRRYNGEDHENGIRLSWTDFRTNPPKTEVLGTNLGWFELEYMLEQILRQGGMENTAFRDLPFPGSPGAIGITLERVKDYDGNDIVISWKPVSVKRVNLKLSSQTPLIEERYHQSDRSSRNSNSRETGEISIRRSMMQHLLNASQNLYTGNWGFREEGTIGARFWLALDPVQTLQILQHQYPRVSDILDRSFRSQYLLEDDFTGV